MTTVLASGAATTECHKLRTGTSETGLRTLEARGSLVPSEAVEGCARPLSWLLLAFCSLVSPQPLPSSSCLSRGLLPLCVCVLVHISLALLQYDLISTSCVCYYPIPK